MIAHVVLFQPRGELDEQTGAMFIDIVGRAAREITSIRRFRIGRRVMHGLGGYEQSMPDHYGYAAIIEFDDVAGLKEYLQHPAHEALGHHFVSSTKRALAYDFALEEAAEVRNVLA